jgi:hypothetical protein
MRVNPNSHLLSATDIPARSQAPSPALGCDQLTLGSTDELNRALQATALARPDQVTRAAALVQDPSYPPTEVIDSVSSLLALYLGEPDPSEQSL